MSKALRGALLIVASGILWGFSGACAQILYENYSLDPRWVVFWRITISSLIFAAIAFSRKKSRTELAAFAHAKGPSWTRALIYSVFGVLGCQMCYMFVISYSNVGIGTTLEEIGLVFVLIISCLQLKRWPNAGEYISLVLALLGCFLIATNGDFTHITLSNEAILWGFLAACALTAYLILPVKLVASWSSLTVNTICMPLAAIFAFFIFQPWNYNVALNWTIVGCMAGVILCGTVGAFLLFIQGLKDTGPVRAGLLDTTEVAASLAFSAIWLGTSYSVYEILGVVCIMAMMVLIALSSAREKE